MHSIRKKALSLQIGSVIYDVDGQDRQGLGKGIVTDIKNNFFYVKFEQKELPMMMNIELFLYDRAGIAGSKRCYLEEEYEENKA